MRVVLPFIFSTCFLFAVVVFTYWAEAVEAKTTVEVIAQANSEDDGYEAFRAMDGKANTFWHSQFRGTVAPLPHTLNVDLTAEFEIKGFTVTPRSDTFFNGVICRFEVFLSNDPEQPGEPILRGELPKELTTQTVLFDKPAKGRYFALKVLSDHIASNYASLAELELHCDTAVFKAKQMTIFEMQMEALKEELGDIINPVQLNEFVLLFGDIKNKPRFDKIADETFLPESLIFETDRDPVDIVIRRTFALLNDLKTFVDTPDLAEQERQLKSLEKDAETIPIEQRDQRLVLFGKLCDVRRKIAFANPLLHFDELLFVKKHRSRYNHMCDQYYGASLPPGGGLFVLENPFGKYGKQPVVRNLLADSVVQSGRLAGQTLSTGSFLSPNLSYEADRIAFAYVECVGDTGHIFHTDPSRGHWHEGRCFHIFTCNIDGSDLRQITDGTWNDFDPCWLPNGRLAFITERRGGYLRCGRECPTYTLFDMNPDGSHIRCLSYHETNEWNPSVTNDGRILYTRWDYLDRHWNASHHPWITTLDGRDPRQVHGNFAVHANIPDMELGCRSVPDSPKFVATAAPHHGQAYGSLILVDPRVPDDDGMAPVKRITPDVDFPETQGGAQVYGAPYPLSEKYYLAVADFAMTPGRGFEFDGQTHDVLQGNYDIYLVDAFGNRELIYRDPEIGCNSPMPIVARTKPHVMPQQISDLIEPQPYLLPHRDKLDTFHQATVSVVNVYKTLRPFPEGTKLKELRVIQCVPMSVPSGAPPHEIGFREPTSLGSVVVARNVLGTVPIEEDGSVHFTVPPRRELQLQVLDEEGLAVQSMRSAFYLHDGETLSCTGCHEQQAAAPVQQPTVPKAFQRPASRLTPAHPDANPFSYARLVQPIWDQHCVACHTEERAKGTDNVPNLAKDPIQNKWYASYNELVPNYGFYSYGETQRTMPGNFGARASKLYSLLKEGHYDVQLSAEELQRVTLWLDCVSIFYGVYEKEGGEAQLRGEIAYPTLE